MLKRQQQFHRILIVHYFSWIFPKIIPQYFKMKYSLPIGEKDRFLYTLPCTTIRVAQLLWLSCPTATTMKKRQSQHLLTSSWKGWQGNWLDSQRSIFGQMGPHPSSKIATCSALCVIWNGWDFPLQLRMTLPPAMARDLMMDLVAMLKGWYTVKFLQDMLMLLMPGHSRQHWQTSQLISK